MTEYQKAEELRKAGKLAEAEPLFAQLWSQSRHGMSGWRYVFCLRKQGKIDDALEVGYEVVEALPEDQWSKNELIWTIHEARIKPAKEQQDLTLILDAAGECFQLGAATNDFALKLIVFAVVDVAKANGKWPIVAEWCDKLDRTTLSAEPTQHGDQQIMADRERWYFARVKAAGELKRWEEARRLGLEAVQTFPRRKDFARWAAKAWAEQGHIEEAIEELKNLLKHSRPEWYLYHDLASYEARAGDTPAALRHSCEAALAQGEDKAKVNLYSLMAQLFLQQGELQTAALSITLVRQVRDREGWSISASVEQVEAQISSAFEASGQSWPNLPEEPHHLRRALMPVWRASVESGLDLQYGTIRRLPPEKDFGFIRPENGTPDIFFKRRDAPPTVLQEGCRVAYIVEPSFDAKKQQEAVRATRIRPA